MPPSARSSSARSAPIAARSFAGELVLAPCPRGAHQGCGGRELGRVRVGLMRGAACGQTWIRFAFVLSTAGMPAPLAGWRNRATRVRTTHGTPPSAIPI